MAGFRCELCERIIELQVRLYACSARLQMQTDDEALHDLRIALRRLRSLLRPLRKQELCMALEKAASAVGDASGPLRDLEVLAGELERRGQPQAAKIRRMQLEGGRSRLLDGVPMLKLGILLDEWPEDQRRALCDGEWRVRGRAVGRYMHRQRQELAEALRDSSHDRHRLRLLIKRIRYCAEAWPQRVQLSGAELKALRKVQSALGDWHDHWQWLQRVLIEPDLAPCAAAWRDCLAQAEQDADQALSELLEYYPLEQRPF